jgi:hypothetical protein
MLPKSDFSNGTKPFLCDYPVNWDPGPLESLLGAALLESRVSLWKKLVCGGCYWFFPELPLEFYYDPELGIPLLRSFSDLILFDCCIFCFPSSLCMLWRVLGFTPCVMGGLLIFLLLVPLSLSLRCRFSELLPYLGCWLVAEVPASLPLSRLTLELEFLVEWWTF